MSGQREALKIENVNLEDNIDTKQLYLKRIQLRIFVKFFQKLGVEIPPIKTVHGKQMKKCILEYENGKLSFKINKKINK